MRSKTWRAWLACLLLVLCGICLNLTTCKKGKVVHELVGYVEGTVIDSLTRLPIDSAWISQTADTTYEPLRLTDSLGYYFVGQFPGKHVVFYCGKKGFVTKASEEFEIKKNQASRVDFELAPLEEQGGYDHEEVGGNSLDVSVNLFSCCGIREE